MGSVSGGVGVRSRRECSCQGEQCGVSHLADPFSRARGYCSCLSPLPFCLSCFGQIFLLFSFVFLTYFFFSYYLTASPSTSTSRPLSPQPPPSHPPPSYLSGFLFFFHPSPREKNIARKGKKVWLNLFRKCRNMRYNVLRPAALTYVVMLSGM